LDTTTRSFYRFWLALGLFQTLLVAGITGGCTGNSSSSDTLFSTSANSAAHAGSENTTASSVQTPGNPNGVRISRAFFEKSIVGKIQIQTADHSISNEIDSNVSWQDLPTTLPAPTGSVIADLREHQGCASFDSLSGVALCFNVVPDISSLGVNDREVKPTGLEGLIAQSSNSPCNPIVKNIAYAQASKVDTSLTVNFTVENQGEGCAPSVQVTMVLRQI
jgi:hypothetical protein